VPILVIASVRLFLAVTKCFISNLREEGFILAHGCKGFNPVLVQTTWHQEQVVEKVLTSWWQKAQREKKGQEQDALKDLVPPARSQLLKFPAFRTSSWGSSLQLRSLWRGISYSNHEQ
jgi:hypothetical protein